MENIVNKISKKAVDTYQMASKATGKFAKEVKLKAKMSENKAKIQELYEDIGKKVYENYVLKQEVNVSQDLINTCSTIDILADEIDDIRMELLKLKDMKQCPNCHYEIYYDFNFCPNCGHIQEEAKEPKENNTTTTIETTDDEDENLTQHIDSFPVEDGTEQDIEKQSNFKSDIKNVEENDDE